MNLDAPPIDSTLRVCRVGTEQLGVLRIFTIIVDGRRAGDLGLDDCHDVQVTPGRHSVYVSMESKTSNTLKVDVEAGAVTELAAELIEDLSPSFFRWVLPNVLAVFGRNGLTFDWHLGYEPGKLRLSDVTRPAET